MTSKKTASIIFKRDKFKCKECHKDVPHVTNLNFKIAKDIYDRFLKTFKKEGNELNEGERDDLFVFIQREVVKKRFYYYVRSMKYNKELTDKRLIETTERLLKEQPEIFDALLEFERTKKVPKFTYKRRFNFTLDPMLMNKFRTYCEKKGIKMSTRIEQHIREDIKKELKPILKR